MEAKLIIAFLVSFIFSLVLLPFVIFVLRKQKIKQTILHYVTMHQGKSGTPTMGGIGFIIPIAVCSLIFSFGAKTQALMTIIITISFALIGFIDDFIKFRFKQNLGLRPYQKIISQLAISVAVAIFVYKNELIGGVINLPFSKNYIEIGAFIIPFTILIFLATTNSVNLTDGLDGLASGVSASFLLTFLLVMLAQLANRNAHESAQLVSEQTNIMIVCASTIGALLAFLIFNSNPAKVFMGDVGSLGLGGLIASVCIFSRNSLFIPIIGSCFVASSVSVIIQVAYFKMKRKRVFLMAPLHHHFEKKGFSETKIVTAYVVLTLVLGFVCVLSEVI